jgi:AhpD family alkylhydroperoxidase
MKMSRLSDLKLLNHGRSALGDFSKAIASDTIEETILELARIRSSQITGCARCLAAHWKAALALDMRVDHLAMINVWREANIFSPREQAALAWTEALTRNADTHVSDAEYDAVRAHFTEEEMVDLTWAILSINTWNRINVAFGTGQAFPFDVPTQPDPVAAT